MKYPSAFIVLVAVAMVAVVAAQGPASNDPMRELLLEVRALRVSLERAMQTGPRIQLFAARVQMQEQRILDVTRRLTSARSAIRGIDEELQGISHSMQELESHVRRVTDADERQAIDDRIQNFKSRVQISTSQRQELMNEEGMLAQQLAQEEARWQAINDRLEELERSLAQKTRD
jgi:predicted  nucleic acid-binding Zn-ribbon protein